MSFSYSGGIITQTGTDANLSGLSGVTGVTEISFGSGVTVYRVNASFFVDGSLTINPHEEMLLLGDTGTTDRDLILNSGGVLTIGSEVTYPSGDPTQSVGTAIWITDGQWEINSGSTVDWYGGAVIFDSVIQYPVECSGEFNTFSQNCILRINTAGSQAQIRINSGSDMNIDGWITDGFALTFIVAPTAISGWAPRNAEGAIAISSSSPDGFLELYDFEPVGNFLGANKFDARFWANKVFRSINGKSGSSIGLGGNSFTSSTNRGLYEIRQTLSVNITSLDSLSVSGVKIYISDVDNGNRIPVLSTPQSIADYVSDRTYEKTTSGSGSVVFDTDGGILTATIYKITGDGQFTNVVYDYRGDNDSDDDVFTIKQVGYLFNLSTSAKALKGVGGTTVDISGITDTSITETDKTIVDAYTVIDDIATGGYDSIKSELIDNYLGETEVIAGRSAAQLLIGSRDLHLNKTAVAVRAYDSFKIDLKTNSAVGGASGTGDVYIENGALLTGGTFDGGGSVIIDANSDGDTYTNVNASKIVHSGSGALTLILDGGTVDELEVTGGADLTITLLNGATITTITETSGTITLKQTVTVQNVNIIDSSRVQLYNITKDVELDNSVVSGGAGYSYTADLQSADVDAGDTLRLIAYYTDATSAKQPLEEFGSITTSGLSFIGTQVDCPVYASWGLDGSTIVKFTADYVNDEVDVVIANNFELREFGAWWCYNMTTEEGIRSFHNGINIVDEANIQIIDSIVDIYLDNTTATNIHQTDNRRLYREDLTRPVKDPTSGGGGIDVEWRSPVSLANTDSITEALEDIYADTQRVDGLIEDDSGDQFTTKALNQAPDSGSDVNVVSVDGDAVTSVDDFKADVSELSTSVEINALNNFDPATDTVVNVTNVATNADMRGTDGANTVAPDNTGIADNGNAIDALNDFNPASDTVARVTLVDTTTANSDMRGTDNASTTEPDNSGIVDNGNAIAALNDFDPASDTVARVTLVDTTTTNSDMRGTDGANTIAPDNAGIVDNGNAIGNLENVSQAQVKAQADQALVDYDGPTKDELTAAFTEIKGATWNALTDTLEAIKNGQFDSVNDRVKVSGTIETLDTLDTAQDVQHATTQADIAAISIDLDTQLVLIKQARDGMLGDAYYDPVASTLELRDYDTPATVIATFDVTLLNGNITAKVKQ